MNKAFVLQCLVPNVDWCGLAMATWIAKYVSVRSCNKEHLHTCTCAHIHRHTDTYARRVYVLLCATRAVVYACSPRNALSGLIKGTDRSI